MVSCPSLTEAENCCNLSVPEPAAEEVLPSRRNHKKKGQRETDLKDFPEEILPPYQYPQKNWIRFMVQATGAE